jgi:hypothetical protein
MLNMRHSLVISLHMRVCVYVSMHLNFMLYLLLFHNQTSINFVTFSLFQIHTQVLRGGVRKSLSVNVQDLHAITPASYLECGDSVFHDLSYHQVLNSKKTTSSSALLTL